MRIYLADPPGSGLHNRVVRGVCYSQQEAEGRHKRHQIDTILEGVGINRVTKNFNAARIDGSFRVSDRETIEMSRFLLEKEGKGNKNRSVTKHI